MLETSNWTVKSEVRYLFFNFELSFFTINKLKNLVIIPTLIHVVDEELNFVYELCVFVWKGNYFNIELECGLVLVDILNNFVNFA